jgi:hemoglobin
MTPAAPEGEQTPYDRLGGEVGLSELVRCFYRKMDHLAAASTIRDLHRKDLGSAEEKLFKFLSGWLGGPQLYWQEYGHPRLRMRHLPFAIGARERDQWLLCMSHALDEKVADADLRRQLLAAFTRTADHMINR